MRSVILLGCLWSGLALAVEPAEPAPLLVELQEVVLVPDFTPGTTSEFSLAFLLQERVIESLSSAGNLVLTGEIVESTVGPLIACADVPSCPVNELRKLPARLALVVRVSRKEGAVSAEYRIFDRASGEVKDSGSLPIPPGQEQDAVSKLVTAVEAQTEELGPIHSESVTSAQTMITEWERSKLPFESPVTLPVEPPKDPPKEEPPELPPEDPPAKPPELELVSDLEKRLTEAGLQPRHIVGARKSFNKTKLPPRKWFFRNTPHAGRLIIEVRGGIGLGDVDRAADVRAYGALNDGVWTQSGDWFQEGPRKNLRVRGGIYLGYAPTTYFDVGTVIGVQYGQKTLTTAYYDGNTSGEISTDVVSAVQLYAQPQVRFTIVPLGAVKPYLYVGADLRIFDGYKIVDPPDVDYPEPPFGFVPGPMGGGGICFDPSPIVGICFDGAYTRHFGIRADAAQAGDMPPDAPEAPRGTFGTVGVTGGVQFRL